MERNDELLIEQKQILEQSLQLVQQPAGEKRETDCSDRTLVTVDRPGKEKSP